MNICILSYGRTGGTTFCNWISKELSKEYIHEPYHPYNLEKYGNVDFSNSNFIIKMEPEHLENIKGEKITIGLIREDISNCAISHLHATETNNWHNPYSITENWIVFNKSKLEVISERISSENNKIRKMNYDITLTYEGLFENKTDIPKICNFLNIENPKHIEDMNVSRKYRKNLDYVKRLI
jgi:hypothetical protein